MSAPAAAAAARLDAAVVVVNYGTAELVERCLRSVRESRGQLELETVVVDNASPQDDVARLQAALPWAQVLAMPQNGGFAAGVNAGVAQTTAELVIVLNPDTEVRAGALQAMLTRLAEHPRAGVVAPLLEDADGRLAPNGYRRFPSLLTAALDMCVPAAYLLAGAPALHPYAMAPAALEAGAPTAHVCGAAMALRRSAYLEAGPLDERFFMYFEETEWQSRLVAHGWSIELEPAARVCHLVRGGGEESLAPSPYFVSSAVRYLRMRHVPALLSRATFAAALLSSWATLRLIALLPAKRERARLQARAYLALLGRLR